MTTSRNEESTAASESELHATAEAAGAGETSVRTAPSEGGTAKPSEPREEAGRSAREEAAEVERTLAPVSAGADAGADKAGQAHEKEGEAEEAEGAEGQEEREEGREEARNETGNATASTAAAETASATATAEEASATVTATTTTATATATAETPGKAGRPNKALLAGAAIAGVLLVTVPFLVHVGDGDDGKRAATNGDAPGTVLGSGKSGIAGAYASAAPSPRDDAGKPSAAEGNGKGDDTSAGDTGGSGPINEGGDTKDADAAGDKSTGSAKTTTGKADTGTTGTGTTGTGTTGTGSAAAGTTNSTTQKSASGSTVVYTGVTGHGCTTPAGGGYQQDGYYSDGSNGWYTRSSGGSTGNGCNGSYAAVPMSGDNAVDGENRVKWWWKPGTAARTCQISVFVPNSNTTLYVGGHPTTYHVLVNANDRTTKYDSFRINQVGHRGQWVDAGTFPMKGSTIGVKMLDRGDDWSTGWEKAHHAAAQMKVTCHS